jgi:DNA-binding CsgD family transcriptional regulator/tetratricopeptide (TPR) repeat protein
VDATDPDLGRLAHHAEGAGDPEAVLSFAPEAARRARDLGASREAVVQYERALRFGDHLEASQLVELLAEYSHACATINDWDRAIAADHRILEIYRLQGDRLKEGWALSFLASCLTSVGRLAEAAEANAGAIEILENLPPGPELAYAYLGRASLHFVDRETEQAGEWAQKAMRLVGEGKDERLFAGAQRYLGSALVVQGDPDGERHLLESLETARRAGYHWGVAGAYSMLGAVLTEVYDFARADECLTSGLAYASEYEQETFQIQQNTFRGVAQFQLGRWSEAEESLEEALARLRRGAKDRIVPLAVRGSLRVRRGVEGAEEDLDEALELARKAPVLPQSARVRAARAEAAWFAGDIDRTGEEALAEVDRALERRHPWFAGQLLSWLALAGRPAPIPDWVAEPYRRQLAGDWPGAAAAWRRLGCVYEAAFADMASGDPEALRRALDVFRDLGAEAAVRVAMRRLRELGVRDIPRGPRPSTRENAANLTRRQAEVVQLLAEGLTNAEIARRLFVSPKTAAHHVSAVLVKLGVRTRAEAVREAARLELLRNQDAPPAT